MTDEPNTVSDGQHRATSRPQERMLEIDEAGMTLFARHVVYSCVRKFNGKDDIPMEFLMDNDDNELATIICGVCKKRLGTCKVGNTGL